MRIIETLNITFICIYIYIYIYIYITFKPFSVILKVQYIHNYIFITFLLSNISESNNSFIMKELFDSEILNIT